MPLSPSESIVATALAAIMVSQIEVMVHPGPLPVTGGVDSSPSQPAVQAVPTGTRAQWLRPSHDPVSRALAASWVDSTLRNYNRSIALYLGWCSSTNIPVQDQLPASEGLLCDYGTSFAGCYSGSAAHNTLARVRALHIFTNAPWNGGP